MLWWVFWRHTKVTSLSLCFNSNLLFCKNLQEWLSWFCFLLWLFFLMISFLSFVGQQCSYAAFQLLLFEVFFFLDLFKYQIGSTCSNIHDKQPPDLVCKSVPSPSPLHPFSCSSFTLKQWTLPPFFFALYRPVNSIIRRACGRARVTSPQGLDGQPSGRSLASERPIAPKLGSSFNLARCAAEVTRVKG